MHLHFTLILQIHLALLMLGSVLVSVGAVVLRGVWVFRGRANWVDSCSCDRALMEKDVTVPPETFRKHVDGCLTHVNRVLRKMSRLFLVEDLVDSLKVSASNYKCYHLNR